MAFCDLPRPPEVSLNLLILSLSFLSLLQKRKIQSFHHGTKVLFYHTNLLLVQNILHFKYSYKVLQSYILFYIFSLLLIDAVLLCFFPNIMRHSNIKKENFFGYFSYCYDKKVPNKGSLKKKQSFSRAGEPDQ